MIFSEKRGKFLTSGGTLQKMRAIFVSDDLFSPDDQNSARACLYRWRNPMQLFTENGLLIPNKKPNCRNFPSYTTEVLDTILNHSHFHLYKVGIEKSPTENIKNTPISIFLV